MQTRTHVDHPNKFGRETVFCLLSFCHIDPVISLKSNCFVTYFCFHWSMNDRQLLKDFLPMFYYLVYSPNPF